MNKTPFSEYKTTEERIAAALERIAVVLEIKERGSTQPIVIDADSAPRAEYEVGDEVVFMGKVQFVTEVTEGYVIFSETPPKGVAT